ncbi:MAG: hypothetical protein NTX45_20635 [Proteobacteria bacterium]|nr:hypothetical protein [Pseudomonadota bacterium]
MLQAVEAILEPSGEVRLLENIRVTAPTRVVVTVIETASTIEPTGQGDTKSLLEFLSENRLPEQSRLSAEEIDAQVEAERNAWE